MRSDCVSAATFDLRGGLTAEDGEKKIGKRWGEGGEKVERW